MEAAIFFIFGVIFGFMAGILITAVPYLYRKHKKNKKHGFGYRSEKKD